VHADAISESGVDHGIGFIHVASACRNESHGEVARFELGERDDRPLDARATVDPDRASAVDEHIRDPRVGDERCEHAEVEPR
jgi:hypothetical protein